MLYSLQWSALQFSSSSAYNWTNWHVIWSNTSWRFVQYIMYMAFNRFSLWLLQTLLKLSTYEITGGRKLNWAVFFFAVTQWYIISFSVCFNLVVYIDMYAQILPHCKIFFTSVYDPNHQLFILNFRGLSFSFPIDSKFEVCEFFSQHCMSAYSITVNNNMKGNR